MSDDDARNASNGGAEKAATEDDRPAAKDDVMHLAQQIASAVNALAGMAQKRARSRYKSARANVESVVSDASGRADAASHAVQGAAATLGETIEEIVQERPLASVAVALGLGFLIGMNWRR